MRHTILQRQYATITTLIGKTQTATSGDFELQGHWGRYLCVLAAGLIEIGIKEIYSDFVGKKAPAPIARYALFHLNQIRNPRTNRIIEIARGFSSVWADQLTAFVDNNGRSEAIDSIMNNRHLIAHGRSANITVARVSEYLGRAVEVIACIEDQCDPSTKFTPRRP